MKIEKKRLGGERSVEFYEDAGGEWRWRLWHRNGRIMADSGEGYKRRSGAIKAYKVVMGIPSSTKLIAEFSHVTKSAVVMVLP